MSNFFSDKDNIKEASSFDIGTFDSNSFEKEAIILLLISSTESIFSFKKSLAILLFGITISAVSFENTYDDRTPTKKSVSSLD